MDGATCSDARLVVSALAARPKRVLLEKLLVGRIPDDDLIAMVAQTAYKQCTPQTSIPYDPDYRHQMVPVFVKRAIREALGVS